MSFLRTLLASILGTLIGLGLILFFLFAFVMAAALSSDSTPIVPTGAVLKVPLSGSIPERVADDPMARAFGDAPANDLDDVRRALRMAAADERINGVWLEVTGVDASWGTLQEIRSALLAFKKSGKPIFAFSRESSTDEADLYLASVADSVFAAPGALTEFNGFSLGVQFYKGLFDKLGLKPQVVRAGRFKSAVEPFLRTDLSPENREQLGALLGAINDTFLRAVSESRRIPVPELARLAAERPVFTAEDARAARLIDGTRFEDQVRNSYKRRLGMTADDELKFISLRDYARVPESDAGIKTGTDGQIALVYATGTIVEGKGGDSGPFGGDDSIGSQTLATALREARDDDDVRAVVLRINSPGGFGPAADAMWREIELTRKAKPLIVSMGDYAASGGYWIATAADTVVADPLTITGSIGAFSVFMEAGGLLEGKLGITYDAVRTSPYADMLSGFRPLSDAERAVLQRSIDQTYTVFRQRVAAARRLPLARVDSLAQGRVWTGTDARRLGLVDVLGGLDTAIHLAARRTGLKEGTYSIRTLPRSRTFVERLTEQLESRAAATWMRLTTSPAEQAALEQARIIHEVMREQGAVQARLPVRITVR